VIKQSAVRPGLMRGLVVVAQILALVALVFGLQFLWNTSGGTLFLFATIGPLLVGAGAIIVAGVLFYTFRKRHSLFEFETFEPGSIIFHQGEEAQCAYFIRSGEVEVLQGAGADQKVVATLSSGQYFGEMALIHNAPLNATVRARTKSTVAVLGKQNFAIMLNLLPSAQGDIMKTVNERAMSQAVNEAVNGPA
jgi:hypothetical protein